jgi:hypothetical protein
LAAQEALEALTGRIVEAMARDDSVDSTALMFLLHRYRATGRDDLRDVLGRGLARAVERRQTATACDERATWLKLFVEAASLSSDDRLRAAVADLISSLRHEWGGTARVADRAASIEVCLIATGTFDVRELVPKAIDELEHLISVTYRPGSGVARSMDEPHDAGRDLVDQIRTASALLTAYVGTWRLPYGMLAEELIQFARRTLWDDGRGVFTERSESSAAPFALNCEAARVLCRLAALHHDDDYRHVAVIAADADYRGDAARILAAQSSEARDRGVDGAIYGLTLSEWLDLQ